MAPLPRPSLCLNIPKTGSSFTSRFFDAADWLELKSRLGWGRPAMPNRAGIEIVRQIKRRGPAWGNLSCRAWDHHAGYSSLPPGLRRHPKLCALREVRSWYGSFYQYYTTAMTGTLLSRAIRMLVDGEDRAVRDQKTRSILSRHRHAFLERFRDENAEAGSLGGLSVAFLVWFTGTVRLEAMMEQWVGMAGTPGRKMGFLTFRAITILFEDPRRVFAMDADACDEYFASGRYMQDLRCDVFLDFDRLSDQLCGVMVDELGYTPEIVAFLREKSGRLNASSDERRPEVLRQLDPGAGSRKRSRTRRSTGTTSSRSRARAVQDRDSGARARRAASEGAQVRPLRLRDSPGLEKAFPPPP